MQAPNSNDRNDKNHKIGDDIDCRGTDKDSKLVNTILITGLDLFFTHALGQHCQDQRQGVEKVPPKNEPDGPINFGFG